MTSERFTPLPDRVTAVVRCQSQNVGEKISRDYDVCHLEDNQFPVWVDAVEKGLELACEY